MFTLGKKTCTNATNKRPAATKKEKGSSKINILMNHILLLSVISKTYCSAKNLIGNFAESWDNLRLRFGFSLFNVGYINSRYQNVFKMNATKHFSRRNQSMRVMKMTRMMRMRMKRMKVMRKWR